MIVEEPGRLLLSGGERRLGVAALDLNDRELLMRGYSTGLQLKGAPAQETYAKAREALDPRYAFAWSKSKSSSRFVSRAVATSRSPDSSTASAMFRPKPLALPMTKHTLFINSCLSSCTYCLVSDRRSAALNWEGVVPSHVRKAR